MDKQKNIPWDEISAFLKREADMQQKATLKAWLMESPGNFVLLRDIISTWQLTRRTQPFYKPEEKVLWDKLVSRIGYKRPIRRSLTRTLRWVAAAAILILVFLTGTWIGKNTVLKKPGELKYSSIVVPPGNRTQTILPDGTKVWLNSGSQLRYPTEFPEVSREVYASGECYFEVAKNKNQRFVVHYADISVQVYGTTFNVNQKANNRETVVSLIEGEVQVVDSENQSFAFLSPGKQLVFSEGKGSVRDARNLQALTSWINNSLVFENQPLTEVVNYLEGWYGVQISLAPELRRSTHRYTFKLKTESLREVLDMISVITPVTYKIEGENVIIGYK
ncbi:MAG: FecR domain-containing protein [Prolixibacteraceae bacterium]